MVIARLSHSPLLHKCPDNVEDKQATRPGRMRMLRRTPAQPPPPPFTSQLVHTCPLRPNPPPLPPPSSRLVQLSAPSHTRAAPFSRVKSVPAFPICPLYLSSFFRHG
ncbi:hypothetical protein V8C44DRAFT_352618 [Trichoderma aethiopicum]